jgi:DNA-binding NarL/FixJ family response regulator
VGVIVLRDEQIRRVLVVDDDAAMRALLESLLGGAGIATATAASGEEALELTRTDPPDLVLLDVQLPGASGYAVCSRLHELYGDAIAVVFLSGERVESHDRVAGLLLGADDYLVKPFAPDELVARLQAVLRRSGPRQAEPATQLTARELEVLGLLADGLPTGGIADRLVISPKTVTTHIERILKKLGVHTRAQAIAVAYRSQLM